MKNALVLMAIVAGALQANIHVPATAALAAAENRPQPEYNPLAKQMHVAGDVTVEVQIGPSGVVETVKLLTGNALLSAPVIKTVKTWKFKPFLQDGQPTTATTVLRFSFK